MRPLGSRTQVVTERDRWGRRTKSGFTDKTRIRRVTRGFVKNAARVLLTWLKLSGCIFLSPLAAGDVPGIARTQRTLQKDRRVVVDRLDPKNNPSGRDDSFLNAVGAVWPFGVDKAGVGYAASTGVRAATGFLIDRCHVLTNMHVVYDDAVVVDPPLAHPVAFAVGQTESERDRGALQGLKVLLPGTVVAHGDTLIVDGRVHNPADDWAVIRLATNVDGAITPMTIAAVELAQLPRHLALSSAGYPSDHRTFRGDGFKLKDLWRSEGEVVGVTPLSSMAALIQTTIQTTPGNSGGPIFGDFNGHRHVVIGIVQSIRGNGIDVSESEPNAGLLFTASTIARITEAQAQDRCR
jgi:V8-like Glu-specific endopeptidase